MSSKNSGETSPFDLIFTISYFSSIFLKKKSRSEGKDIKKSQVVVFKFICIITLNLIKLWLCWKYIVFWTVISGSIFTHINIYFNLNITAYFWKYRCRVNLLN